MGYKMSGSPHKMGTIIGASAFKQERVSQKKKKSNFVTYGQDLYNSDGTKSNISREHTTEIKSDKNGNQYVYDERNIGGTKYFLEKPNKSNEPIT